ncbi:MAG TPA: hypothetical protein VJV79_12165 [Polyangiaceae bacterium]|nr:hypothetical protein [Polyangiaceae bacterium]
MSSFGAALQLDADYRFANGIGALLRGGFVSTTLNVDGTAPRGGTFPGNAFAGITYARELGAGFDGRLSLRVGAPLALFPGGIDQNRLAELAYTMAASAQGYRDPFVWQTNALPVVVSAKTALLALDWLTLSFELEPAYVISVNQRPSRLACAAHFDATAVAGVIVGHAGFNYFLSSLALENHEFDQLALRFGAGTTLHGQRVLLDAAIGLDDPYGAFQSQPHPWWGIILALTANFGPSR